MVSNYSISYFDFSLHVSSIFLLSVDWLFLHIGTPDLQELLHLSALTTREEMPDSCLSPKLNKNSPRVRTRYLVLDLVSIPGPINCESSSCST